MVITSINLFIVIKQKMLLFMFFFPALALCSHAMCESVLLRALKRGWDQGAF